MLPAHKHTLETLLTSAVKQVALATQGASEAAFVEPSIVLERPKVAAHGDVASNVAMQLAKPLRANPRQLAQQIVDAVLANPAAKGLVDGAEVAGPGFINLRLAAAAKQAVVPAVLAEGARLRPFHPRSRQARAGRVRLGQPDRAAARRPRPPGRARRRDLQPARDAGLRGACASSTTTTPACRSQRSRSRRKRAPEGLKPGDAGWPEAAYNGDYIADIAADFLAGKTVKADDRAVHRLAATSTTSTRSAQFAVAYLRHEQDLDLKAFGVKLRPLLPGVAPVHERPGRGDGRRAGRRRQDLRAGRRALAAHHRLRRRQGPRDAQVRRHATPTSCPTSPITSPSGSAASRKVINVQGTDHHGTIARVRAGLQAAGRRHPEGLPRLRAAQDGDA